MAILKPVRGPVKLPRVCTLPKFKTRPTKMFGGVHFISRDCHGGPWDGRRVAIPNGDTLTLNIGGQRGKYVWVTRKSFSDDAKHAHMSAGDNWIEAS